MQLWSVVKMTQCAFKMCIKPSFGMLDMKMMVVEN